MAQPDEFDQATSGGKAFPFPQIGAKFWDGRITARNVVEVEGYDGTPKRVPVLEFELPDGSVSTVWLSGGKFTAYRAALTAAGLKTIAVGDLLSMKFEREEPASKAGYNPRKVYVAKITPAAAATQAPATPAPVPAGEEPF